MFNMDDAFREYLSSGALKGIRLKSLIIETEGPKQDIQN